MVSEVGPRSVTSKRRVVYRRSAWAVHEWEVWSGSLVCRCAALRMSGSLLLWVGGDRPALGELALGVPDPGAGSALSTALTSAGADEPGGAGALARRLAAALRRPVWVAAALPLDRFTAPLVARGLVAEIKSRPDFFDAPTGEPPSAPRARSPT